MIGWRCGVIAILCALVLPAAGQVPDFSVRAQQRLLTGLEGEAALAQRQLRQQLVDQGESLLISGDTAGARRAFERAAGMAHLADIELGLVRVQMQEGAYRQALAFAAHTAGAHADISEGAALYAWLLHIGGQAPAARRVLEDATRRLPADSILSRVLARIEGPTLPVDEQPEGLLSPYALGEQVPREAKHVSSGMLLSGHNLAIVPLEALGPGPRFWLRDGLGRTSAADLLKSDAGLGLALLHVRGPSPSSGGATAAAPRGAFAGSPAFAFGYAKGTGNRPQWPRLVFGFLGRATTSEGSHPLGFELNGTAPGGPVLNAQGDWIGVSLGDAVAGQISPRMVSAESLRSIWPEVAAATESAASSVNRPRLAFDELYQRALPWVVDVMALRMEDRAAQR